MVAETATYFEATRRHSEAKRRQQQLRERHNQATMKTPEEEKALSE
jgi:hypothetical protein